MPVKNTDKRGQKPPPSFLHLPQSNTPRPVSAGAQGFGVSGMRKATPSLSSPAPSDDARYVVYLRLPFPRNGFVDPPPVDWDSTKERNLWKVISRSARNSELDWNDLADKFNVSVPFLLQQAAWLYERELSQVRAQLRRVGNTALGGTATPTSPTASPNLRDMRTVSTSAVKTTAVPMSPSPSRQGNLVPASAPTTRVPSTAPPMSRTTSTATARPVPPQNPLQPINTMFAGTNLSQAQTPVPQNQHLPSTSPLSHHRQPSNDILTQSRLYQPSSTLRRSISTKSTSSTSSETSSTDNEDRILPKRRVLKRADLDSTSSALGSHKEDENPAFLPWHEADKAAEEDNDSSTVVTGGVTRRERPGSRPLGGYESDRDKNTSGGTIRRGFSQQQQQQQQVYQQQQQLQQQGQGQGQGQGQQQTPSRNIGNPDSDSSNQGSVSNPRRKTNGEGKRVGGHESSPSMGSSFSDLSDASVSQSALEEQYMSAMGGGGLASRMSTLTNFNPRSRYF